MKGFLRLRGSTYYFRCRVPHDLHGTFFRGQEILKSLHTRDRKHAQESAAEWYCRVNRVFHLCRMRSLPPEQLQALVTSELFPSNKGDTYRSTARHLKDLLDSYVSEHKVNWREKSYDEVTYSLGLALDVIGNVETSQLSPEVLKSYLATILQLPANHRKKPALRNLSVKEILKVDGLSPMSRKSVCKHMQWLGAALKHAKMEHLLDGVVLPTITRNPYEERSIYAPEELQRILDNLKWEEDHPDRLWVPLVGMLQGMRLNEICQLHVADVSLDGIPAISINDDEGKQVKNADSYRRIPLHPKLIDLGFLGYVRRVKGAGEARLFHQLKPHRGAYGHYTGKWFQMFNRKHITPDPKKVFHSLRHGFIDYLANNSEAKEHQIAWLVGHTNRKSETAGRYTKPPTPAQLLPIIDMYDCWKGITWGAVEAEARKGGGGL
jgi:integrase